ncbi:hypothetical protein FRUB_04200 [Fimbriiglobus ruber]|uniref:Response regulatory domain-containing protein n=1 Tax=Fimbriiglobus ruber TaxID=1908690 RepID=A0A225DL31_9BACT|nr:hypothetical protein FRUB_04200 [Fimbriiglobus ruber]
MAVTARSDTESRRRVHDAGLKPHLVKPVDPRELVAVIKGAWEACYAADALI